MKVTEIINSTEPLNRSISFKVNNETFTLLHKVFQERLKNGLSNDFSHFLRQCLTVALLCDNPAEYLPQFEIPNIENLFQLEEKEETQIETQEENETENE